MREVEVANQRQALVELTNQTRKFVHDFDVSKAARQIVAGCAARDDVCELEALFTAVKHGTEKVPGLEDGVRYTSDAATVDQFFSPKRLLAMCRDGACAGDCDDVASLLAAMAGSIGFKSGLCAWARSRSEDYSHVFAVAKYPKHAAEKDQKLIALDTTVPEAGFGWAPPEGHFLIAWL